tara:strand:+ start:660 stop:1724 length:1065 start_codon:yes stop_codon:yes gene_type:complete
MNYKTITDIIGKGILAGTMAFGGMLPSYGEEAKAPKQSIEEIMEDVERMNQEALEDLPNTINDTTNLIKALRHGLEQDAIKADKYDARVNEYANLAAAERYAIGLAALLKDKEKVKQYDIKVDDGKLTIAIKDFVFTPDGFERPIRRVEAQSFADIVDLEVTDDNGNDVGEPNRNVKAEVSRFVMHVLGAGRESYVGESPSGNLGMGEDFKADFRTVFELKNSYRKRKTSQVPKNTPLSDFLPYVNNLNEVVKGEKGGDGIVFLPFNNFSKEEILLIFNGRYNFNPLIRGKLELPGQEETPLYNTFDKAQKAEPNSQYVGFDLKTGMVKRIQDEKGKPYVQIQTNPSGEQYFRK